MKKTNQFIVMLKVCAVLIFSGRAYQYLFFNAPFRNILWDEELLSPIVEGWFGMPWTQYVSSTPVDEIIQGTIRGNGLLFVIAAIACAFLTKQNIKLLKIPIYAGAVTLVLLAALSYRETFQHYGQFFEHALQIGVPIILLLTIQNRISIKSITTLIKVLIAITFVSHGLYALGYYPIPGNFVNMTITSLGVTEAVARQILWTAGILDMVLAVLIFVPKVSKYALLYAAFWGLATAMARFIAPFSFDFLATSIHQTIYQVAFRLPHGLVPLTLFIYTFSHFTTTQLIKRTPINQKAII